MIEKRFKKQEVKKVNDVIISEEDIEEYDYIKDKEKIRNCRELKKKREHEHNKYKDLKYDDNWM